jgi:flagellar basal-body rod protein FlgG
MSHLIEANRLVGMYQRVMDTQMNELNRDAIERLGSTKS